MPSWILKLIYYTAVAVHKILINNNNIDNADNSVWFMNVANSDADIFLDKIILFYDFSSKNNNNKSTLR